MAHWKKTAKWKRARAAEIVARDGPLCWLCNLAILAAPKKQGRRASIEHLEARCLGGGDALENLVLCHDSCNRHLGDRRVAQKRKMREKWHRTARHKGSRRTASRRK
jgi:5-methylcytosine-specific restriction endonuclease McrA